MKTLVGYDSSELKVSTIGDKTFVRSSDGKLVLFVLDTNANAIKYKVSSDNGQTWSNNWTTAYERSGYTLQRFSLCIDSNNHILIAIVEKYSTTYYLSFRKLTYSSGSWTIGTTKYGITSSSYTSYWGVGRASDGAVYIGGMMYSWRQLYKSTDEGANWTSLGSTTLTEGKASFLIINDIIWIFNRTATALYAYKYSGGSWTNTTIASSLYNSNEIDSLAISSNEIYVATSNSPYDLHNLDLLVYKFNGSSWTSIQIPNKENLYPSLFRLANINGIASIIWMYKDLNTNKSKIYYSTIDLSRQSILLTEENILSLNCINNSSIFYLSYVRYVNSNYEVYFISQKIGSDISSLSIINTSENYLVGTNTQYGLQPNSRRCVIKLSNQHLFIFVADSNKIKYKKSADNGQTWDTNWTTVITLGSGATINTFSVYLDDNENLLMVIDFQETLYKVYFRKLQYINNSWQVVNSGTINAGASSGYPLTSTITRRSNGDIWVIARRMSYAQFYCYYSTDEGSTWTSSLLDFGTGGSSTLTVVGCLRVGTQIWAFGQDNGYLKVFKYSGSWDSGTTLSNYQVDVNSSCGLAVSENEVYIASVSKYGLKVWKYNGTDWNSWYLSYNPNDVNPSLANISGKIICFWKHFEGSDSYIVYKSLSEFNTESLNKITYSDTYYNPTTLEKSDTYLHVAYVTSTYNIYCFSKNLKNRILKNIYSNAYISNVNIEQIYSLSYIKVKNNIKEIDSNSIITSSKRKNINSISYIKQFNILKEITSDSKIVYRYSKELLSDSHIKSLGIQKNIYSNSSISIFSFYHIGNVFFAKLGSIHNINNSIAFKLEKKFDIGMVFVSAKYNLFNVNNDIRTKKSVSSNINNDIRFIKYYLKPGKAGFQSLGKQYIKVYFNNVEQTDVVVDRITISKGLNSAHTATLELARPYDVNIPALETEVVIKYSDWILYKGYISRVSSSDNPENIRVDCQDKYWLRNRHYVNFFVGHEPLANKYETDPQKKDKWYSTINDALKYEFDWNLNIGKFVPQTISCGNTEESDALSNLITNCGNYSWYYDVNGNKILWIGGKGTIINIERQKLDKNIDLFQVISHNLQKNSEDIVNRYFVQMGGVKTNVSGGSITYSYPYFNTAIPAWNRELQILAKNSALGFGWDYHPSEYSKIYSDVFRKYYLPNISSFKEGGYSIDEKMPIYIEIYRYYSSWETLWKSWTIFNPYYGTFTDGFTIDLTSGILMLNFPVYVAYFNNKGELVTVEPIYPRPVFWIKKTISWSAYEKENPLSFYTEKVGEYPLTITKTLYLTELEKRTNPQTKYYYNYYTIPAYDDTEYAKDYAHWMLSKTCDEKISGSIDLTLDAIVYYNVDLDKRIFIDGITEQPLNIVSMYFDLSNFTVSIDVENIRSYTRTVSLPWHGE